MYRVCKVDKGWIVERLEFRYKILGLHFWQVWRPYIKARGSDDYCYHKTKEAAISSLLEQVKKEIF